MGALEYLPTNNFCEVKDACITVNAGTNDVSIVSAVSGKKIVVLSANLYSAGAAGTLTFKSGAGGTAKWSGLVPVNTAATPNVQLQPNPFGHFRTASGVALVADNAGAANIVVSVQYIEVAP